MERLILTNGNVIRPTRIESGMAVVCRNGRIERILPGNGVTPEPGDRVIDARGGYIAPGFIDMHVHGGGGYDFMDGTVEAFLGVAETHARYGTTALVPTTLTCTDEELYRVFEVFREAGRCNKRGARLLGLHLEGPYFSHPGSALSEDPPPRGVRDDSRSRPGNHPLECRSGAGRRSRNGTRTAPSRDFGLCGAYRRCV